MVYRIALLCLALGFTTALYAQAPASFTPAQVDSVFAKWNKTDSPGCALAVLQNSSPVYERGYGMADLEHDAPITPATPFHVASVSKQFTAAAILLLAQQGKLSLDDDIRKYIPELHDFGVTIRIRHLLHHTSGLRDQWDLLNLAGWRYSFDLITDADVMSLVYRQSNLNFSPGSKYLYSNTGYTLLGQIVKRTSGQSLREFTTKNIFEPLGMKNTHFRDDHAEIIKGEALGYIPAERGTFRLSVTNFDTVGATSLYTTVEDLAKWDENFYSRNVGGPNFTALMTQTDKLNSGKDNNYALGLVVGSYRGLPAVEHSGADAGYRSDIIRFPKQHFSVVSLCNTPANPALLNRAVADLYLAAQFKEPPPVIPNLQDSVRLLPDQIAGKSGFYRLGDIGLVMKIDSEKGNLQIVEDDNKSPLAMDGKGNFALPNPAWIGRFERSERAAERLVIQPLTFPTNILSGSWDHLPDFTLPSGTESEYTGSYYSDELDATYRIEEVDGKLMLKRKKYPDEVVTPVGHDLFTARVSVPSSSMGAVEFERDSSGRVVGLSLTTGRVLHLKFTRER